MSRFCGDKGNTVNLEFCLYRRLVLELPSWNSRFSSFAMFEIRSCTLSGLHLWPVAASGKRKRTMCTSLQGFFVWIYGEILPKGSGWNPLLQQDSHLYCWQVQSKWIVHTAGSMGAGANFDPDEVYSHLLRYISFTNFVSIFVLRMLKSGDVISYSI